MVEIYKPYLKGEQNIWKTFLFTKTEFLAKKASHLARMSSSLIRLL